MTGRAVHLKREPFDVRIDRTTPWGNPFVIGRKERGGDGTRRQVIEQYRRWLLYDEEAAWVRDHVHELEGKVLGCWCAPKACHGEVLLELASVALHREGLL